VITTVLLATILVAPSGAQTPARAPTDASAKRVTPDRAPAAGPSVLPTPRFQPVGTVEIFARGIVYDRGRGYENRTLLSADINTPGTWTFGPSIAPAEPGVLYFTSKREGGAGRMDIYRVRYEIK
jgi:hypothetical protein